MSRRLFQSVLLAWLVLVVELVAVAFFERHRLAGIWEIQFGTLWLAPTLLAGSAVVGAAGGLLLELCRQAQRREQRWLLTSLVFLAAGTTGWAVGGGRLLSALGQRLGFALLVAVVAAGVCFVAAPWLARRMARRPAEVALLALCAVLVLELANRFLLVRLYPAFHVALAVSSLLVAPWLGLALPVPPARRWGFKRWLPVGSLLVVTACAALLAKPAAAKLGYFDNFRLVFLEQAPLLGQGIRVAGWLEPPPALAELDCLAEGAGVTCSELPVAAPARLSIDLRQHDLLLISIDALRADHVGAYGYQRKTTPNIDKLAAEGVLFEYAYAPTPHTSYSITSLLAGKYMRPLLLQGAGQESDSWAKLLRGYGYRTAAFYPPAVFFIDSERFESFQKRGLDFEYRKEEFAEGALRVRQVAEYLDNRPSDRRTFVWVHLFGPHEPYERQAGFDFGDRDVDRYDGEIAAADRTVGELVELMRKRRPRTAVIVTADHGEEFGEHGGRYHGTTVYEEQVRVPLVLSAPGVNLPARRIREPVQTIDLLPTVLAALDIPAPPRLRGRDLGPLLGRKVQGGPGFAFAETEEQALLARGMLRLVCAKKLGACALFDLEKDPAERYDVGRQRLAELEKMRAELQSLSASHGRYEVRGLRAEGKAWPEAILRGVAGDADAAEEIAALLDDADRAVRRKAAELLFELRRSETAPALRLSVQREEDATVRRWAALALRRLGQGAPLADELVRDEDLAWRRLSALVLAEQGDDRGGAILIDWWKDSKARDYTRSLELLEAFAAIRERDATYFLVQSLNDVRLRPHIARTLSVFGDDFARSALLRAFASERYQSARVALCASLVELGVGPELAVPLTRFLGVPDPLPGGLGFAARAKILEHVGGPAGDDLARLRRQANLGVALKLVVPRGGNGRGVRALVRARAHDMPGYVLISPGDNLFRYDREGKVKRTRNIPSIDSKRVLRLRIEPGADYQEVSANTPKELGAKPGHSGHFVVFADRHVQIEALALVPQSDELPPPPPKPWKPLQASVRP